MKHLFKLVAFIMITNFMIGVSVLGYVLLGTVVPVLQNTDLPFSSIISGNLTDSQYSAIRQDMNAQASQLGKDMGRSFGTMLQRLFPPSDFSYSDLTPVDYPYPSLDEVMGMNDEIAIRGAKEALDMLESFEDDFQDAREKGLKMLED